MGGGVSSWAGVDIVGTMGAASARGEEIDEGVDDRVCRVVGGYAGIGATGRRGELKFEANVRSIVWPECPPENGMGEEEKGIGEVDAMGVGSAV